MSPTLAERLTEIEDRIQGPEGLDGRLIRLEVTVAQHEEADKERHTQVMSKLDTLATKFEHQDQRLWKLMLILVGIAFGVNGIAEGAKELITQGTTP